MTTNTEIKTWADRLTNGQNHYATTNEARDAEIAELRAALAATEHRAWCAEVNEDGAREHLAEVQKAVSLPVGAVVAMRTVAEIDTDIATGGGLGRMDRLIKERKAALASQPAKPADVGGVVDERVEFEAWIRMKMRKNVPWASDDDIDSHLKRSGFNSDHYLTREQEWKGWQARAALAAQTAAPGVKVDPLPEGWEASHAPPWDALTPEAQGQQRYAVKRLAPPYCDKANMRVWFGPTLAAALQSAREALGMPSASPQPVDGAAGVKPEGFKLRTSQGPLFCEQEPSVDRDLWVALYTAAPAPAAPVDLSDGADSCTVGCLRRDI